MHNYVHHKIRGSKASVGERVYGMHVHTIE